VFDESLCIYQGIFGDVAEMWLDPGVRDYYVQPQPAIYDCFMKSKVTQGSFIWCWSDDIFCVPGRGLEYGRGATRSHFIENAYRVAHRGLVGDAPWGVVDGWRRKKPEFWITKKLHSPVKVKEDPLPLPAPGQPLRVAIENQYDFRNLSELAIHWAVGDQNGVADADVPPRSMGHIDIPIGHPVQQGDMLDLEFKDAGDRSIDVYRVPLGREPLHVPPYKPCAPGELRIGHENTLAGPATTITGKDFQLAIDDGAGLLRRGVVKGEALLLELPALHVLPTSRPLQPLPDRLTWHLDKLDVQKQGENVRTTIRGQYKDFPGGYELTITPSGDITIASSFEYAGDEFPAREIGMRFSVPTDCNVLDWNRRAEWRVYPADHIGRPRGTAPAFPSGPPQTWGRNDAGAVSTSGPTWPWAHDISPMGSNDFRSTKRNIYWAALHSSAGPAAVVESDGRQHVRACVESDRISLHVNDWYGGTNAGWWEWTHNYGQGQTIRKGDRLTSTLRLRVSPRLSRPDR
jgi:beta-galactosidase